MITRAQKVRLGIFVSVSMTLLLGMLAVLVGERLGDKRDVYTTSFEETVSGLEIGAPVKYQGVRVGRVDEIAINPERVSEVVVTLSLKSGTPVKKDTIAVMNTMGITGLKFVELTGGTDDSGFHTPGERIDSGSSLLDRLSGKADVIATKVELLVNNLNALTNDEQRERITAILEGARNSLDSAERILKDNEAGIKEALAAFAETADQVALLAIGAQEMLELAEIKLDTVVARFDAVGADVQVLLANQDHNLTKLLVDTDDTVLAVQKVVKSDDVLRLPRRTVEAVVAFKDLVLETQGKVATFMTHLNQAGVTINARLSDQRIDQVLDHAASISASGEDLVAGLDLTVRQSREDIFKTLSQLEDVVRNLNDFTQMLLDNPSILLRGSQLDERKL